jgi:glycosyltransferase involved in cell wall biosynthesis
VAEALACGTMLLASDIPVLREVGGDVPVYMPVGDVAAWAAAALELLDPNHNPPDARAARRAAGLARARRYSWTEHAQRLAQIYEEVLSRPLPP